MPRAKDSAPALTNKQLRALAAGRTPQQIGEAIMKMLSAGRRRGELDLDRLVKMRMAGCSISEIAAEFGVDEKTIDRRLAKDPLFRQGFDDGDKRGKAAIRMQQYLKAVVDRDLGALIWVGKQRLHQTDKPTDNRASDRFNEVIAALKSAPGETNIAEEDNIRPVA